MPSRNTYTHTPRLRDGHFEKDSDNFCNPKRVFKLDDNTILGHWLVLLVREPLISEMLSSGMSHVFLQDWRCDARGTGIRYRILLWELERCSDVYGGAKFKSPRPANSASVCRGPLDLNIFKAVGVQIGDALVA